MIILKCRTYSTEEMRLNLSKEYGKQLDNGVLVLDDNMDLVHVSEPENEVTVINTHNYFGPEEEIELRELDPESEAQRSTNEAEL